MHKKWTVPSGARVRIGKLRKRLTKEEKRRVNKGARRAARECARKHRHA